MSSRSEITAQLANVPRQSLKMGGESVSRRGETDHQPLVDAMKRAIGRAIERAIKSADLEKKDVAERMGYTDQSVIGRWIAGVETPQFAKLFAIDELQIHLVIALARIPKDAEIVTTITVRRSA
jgi:hypothetical protein